jgi:hypothetical protein
MDDFKSGATVIGVSPFCLTLDRFSMTECAAKLQSPPTRMRRSAKNYDAVQDARAEYAGVSM